MMDADAIKARFERLSPFLDERARRLFAANEAIAAGWGGVTVVSAATGVTRSTIGHGLAELQSESAPLSGRIRRPGGGGKPKTQIELGLLAALEELVQSAIPGDPEAALLWVSRSQRHLVRALAERGFSASQKLVGRLLRQLGFSLQANRKTREGASHPDRNAQFEYSTRRSNSSRRPDSPPSRSTQRKRSLSGTSRMADASCAPKATPNRCVS